MAETTRTRYQELLRDPVLWVGVVVTVVAFLLYSFPLSDPEEWYFALELYALVPIVAIGIVAPWVDIPPLKEPSAKLFWVLWTLALGFLLSVRVLNILVEEARDYLRLGVDLGYVLFYLAVVLALQVKPGRRGEARHWRAHHLLEAAGTGAFVLVLMIYFVLIPQWMSPDFYQTWIPSLILFVSLDAFLVLNLIYLRQTTPDADWRIVYTWLAFATLWWAGTDLAELLFYLDLLSLPDYGYQDFLWFVPWSLVLVSARIRAHPVPALFGRFTGDRAPLTEDQRLARPGWLVVAALALPLIHFGANLLNLMDPETRNAREVVVLLSLLLLLTLAWLHQRALHRRAATLAEKNREGEARRRLLAAAVEQASDGILIADAERVVRFANRAFREAGGDPSAVLDSPLEDTLPGGLEGTGEESLSHALSRGRAWEGRHRFGGEAGEEREESVMVSPVLDPGGGVAHWIVVRRDVTYLKQLERQSRQSQKMEALGTLAGGIAHDFNNILGAIYGYAELLSWEMEPGSEAREDLQGLLTAAERATGLVSQILTFSRQGEEERKALALEPLLKEGLTLLRATLPSTVRIHESIQQDAGAVLGVRSQLQQIILNLGSNAAQAMAEKGGILSVGLVGLSLDPEEAGDMGLPPGHYLRLSFQDTGVGMAEKTVEKIFDPFFTTKEVGEGTGLGLSVVHGAVTSHDGAVRVESELGTGTLFEVFLPATDLVPRADASLDAPPPSGEGQSLVIVDDEPELVKVSTAMLESLGYRVTRFTDSREALDHILGNRDSVDVLMTDQTMPGLTGLGLAKELTDEIPGLKVLLATGYSELLSKEQLEACRVGRLLMKPFTKGQLGWAVAELLAEGDAAA